MPPKMNPPLSVPGKIAMPSAFIVIEAGMDSIRGRHHLIEHGDGLADAAGLFRVRSFLGSGGEGECETRGESERE